MKQITVAASPHHIRLAAVLKRNATIPSVRLDRRDDTLRQCAKIEFLPRHFQRLREIEKGSNDTVQAVDLVRHHPNFLLGFRIALNDGFDQSYTRSNCV